VEIVKKQSAKEPPLEIKDTENPFKQYTMTHISMMDRGILNWCRVNLRKFFLNEDGGYTEDQLDRLYKKGKEVEKRLRADGIDIRDELTAALDEESDMEDIDLENEVDVSDLPEWDDFNYEEFKATMAEKYGAEKEYAGSDAEGGEEKAAEEGEGEGD